MSKDLIVKPHPTDESSFLLVEDFEYTGLRDKWRIPAGFKTDFASVPKVLWWILPPHGKHAKAAVVHDWLYVVRPEVRATKLGNTWTASTYTRHVTRREADGVFRRIMKECGVGWLRRYIMWAGVRLGGWVSWMQRHGQAT